MAKANESLTPRETILVQFGGEFPSQVHQGLRDKRYTSRIVNDLQSLERTIQSMSEPILIFHGGESPQSVQACVDYLRELAPKAPLPVIFIGIEAGSFERELEQNYPCATTLNTPFGTAEVLAAINYITRSYTDKKTRGTIKKAVPPPAEPIVEEMPAEPEVAPVVVVDPSQLSSIEREKTFGDGIFGNLGALDLLNRDLGGGLFASGEISREYLASHGMMPNEPAVTKVIEEILFDVGKWGRLHLFRVTYMAQKLLEAMKPDSALTAQVQCSALLYPWAFVGDEAELLKINFLDSRATSKREHLAERIAESAKMLGETLALNNVSGVVKELGELVRTGERPQNTDIGITASALFAADLTSRFCFGGGSWNPRRGYVLLARMKRGEFQEIHDLVLCCSIKFLAEALAARTPIFMLKRELRTNKEFLASLAREAHLPVKKDERRVPVSSLSPGMKLSRPLQALDGREILSPDLTLDADLIWRIWQLSAIRPLKSAVVRMRQSKSK